MKIILQVLFNLNKIKTVYLINVNKSCRSIFVKAFFLYILIIMSQYLLIGVFSYFGISAIPFKIMRMEVFLMKILFYIINFLLIFLWIKLIAFINNLDKLRLDSFKYAVLLSISFVYYALPVVGILFWVIHSICVINNNIGNMLGRKKAVIVISSWLLIPVLIFLLSFDPVVFYSFNLYE